LRVRVLSDLHLEFEPRGPIAGAVEWRFGQGGLPSVPADLVVLAGDIALGADGVRWARRTFREPVVYVAGNHEFYRRQLQDTLSALDAEAAGSNVHFLEDRELRIAIAGSDVRVLGATLWTDFLLEGALNRQAAMYIAERAMSDYAVIRFADPARGERPLRADDTAAANARSRAFLERSLATPFAGTTIVVTHMLPSPRSLSPSWTGSPLNGAFASDLEALVVRHQPALWIHGHTHESSDYRIGNTRVVCNPRGYVPHELNPAFDPTLVVDV
jgi:predicted phosphodiesterase